MKYSSDDLLPMLPALIEMQTHRRWVCWCAIERKGAMTKAPYNPHTGEFARTNDGRTWGTYRQAFETWQRHPNLYSGLGYVFTGQISGIDLDHCVDERGNIEQWARQILILIGSYAEYSPSKTGIHIYVKGKVAHGTRRPVPPGWGARHPKAAIELYSTGRFFTVTGAHIPETSVSLASNQKGIDDLLRRLVPGFDALKRVRQASDWEDAQRWASQPPDACVPQRTWPIALPIPQAPTSSNEAVPGEQPEAADAQLVRQPPGGPDLGDDDQSRQRGQKQQQKIAPAEPPPVSSSLTDAELLQKAQAADNGDRFRALYIEGSTRDYGSASEADLALCNHLAFWTGRDAARMDRLFRASALYRRKWDERRGQDTYGQRTIQTAITGCTEVYQPAQKRSKRDRKRERKELLRARKAAQVGASSRAPDSVVEQAAGAVLPDPDRNLRELLQRLGITATVPWEFVWDCLERGKRGDVSLFVYLFVRRVRYDRDEKRWYLFKCHVWEWTENDLIAILTTDALVAVYEHLTHLFMKEQNTTKKPQQLIETHKALAPVLKRVKAIQDHLHINRVLERSRGYPDLEVRSAVWDNEPDLLATPDGVLDLRTGELRTGQPEDYLRTVIPTHWEGLDAPAPRFERFLHEIFADRPDAERQELIDFLQRVLGYGITGHVSEHQFLLFLGEEGRNGKDTLLSILAYVLGESVGAVPNDIFVATNRPSSPGSPSPHLYKLHGMRIAWCSETDKGARFDLAQVKLLTGGGEIVARNLFSNLFSFQPSHLLILLTNNRPHADASDHAFWERLCPIVFRMRFVDEPTGPNERLRDRDLLASLRAEAPGILAWLVRGNLAWRRHGLQLPQSVKRERASYRQLEDTFGLFLDECCYRDPTVSVRAKALYDRYKVWCDEGNLKCMSHVLFGQEMVKQFERQRYEYGYAYAGIGLLAAEDEAVR